MEHDLQISTMNTLIIIYPGDKVKQIQRHQTQAQTTVTTLLLHDGILDKTVVRQCTLVNLGDRQVKVKTTLNSKDMPTTPSTRCSLQYDEQDLQPQRIQQLARQPATKLLELFTKNTGITPMHGQLQTSRHIPHN